MTGYANTYLNIRPDGTVAAYRNNVREPLITGLRAFRTARRECLGRIEQLAGIPVTFDRISLRRTNQRSIHMVVGARPTGP
jgi:hypothetical protein